MIHAPAIFFASLLIALVAIAYLCYAGARAVRERRERRKQRYDLARHPANPIIAPHAHKEWEAEGTFNPGAVIDSDGIVHVFYRAIGRDGISRIGHATSRDGVHFDDRSDYPVFQPRSGWGMPHMTLVPGPHWFDRIAHPSGGGWGGSEDPRIVKLNGRVYMTYTSFEGWHNMRMALTSISEEELRTNKWNWKRPVIISPPNQRAKNWVLFPEKINGKFAILHAVSPRVMVAYVDSPELVPDIQSARDHGGYGNMDNGRKGMWDELMKGAGAPPLKTDLGWLLLYHAIHENKYKIGAMILDRRDPTKVLYRSPQPILAPDMHYENDGKPGVVYGTGAVIKDGKLYVYYGGGDKNTCVAETPLDPLLKWLMEYGKLF